MIIDKNIKLDSRLQTKDTEHFNQISYNKSIDTKIGTFHYFNTIFKISLNELRSKMEYINDHFKAINFSHDDYIECQVLCSYISTDDILKYSVDEIKDMTIYLSNKNKIIENFIYMLLNDDFNHNNKLYRITQQYLKNESPVITTYNGIKGISDDEMNHIINAYNK